MIVQEQQEHQDKLQRRALAVLARCYQVLKKPILGKSLYPEVERQCHGDHELLIACQQILDRMAEQMLERQK